VPLLRAAADEPSSALQGALQWALYSAIVGPLETTPLNVAKICIELTESSDPMASGNVLTALKAVYAERRIRGLSAGVVP